MRNQLEQAKSHAASARALLRKAKGKKHSIIKARMDDKEQIQKDLQQSKVAYEESCGRATLTSGDTSNDEVRRSNLKQKLECQAQQMKISSLKKVLQGARQKLRKNCKAVHGALEEKEKADFDVMKYRAILEESIEELESALVIPKPPTMESSPSATQPESPTGVESAIKEALKKAGRSQAKENKSEDLKQD